MIDTQSIERGESKHEFYYTRFMRGRRLCLEFFFRLGGGELFACNFPCDGDTAMDRQSAIEKAHSKCERFIKRNLSEAGKKAVDALVGSVDPK